jgi:hypothetical protein
LPHESPGPYDLAMSEGGPAGTGSPGGGPGGVHPAGATADLSARLAALGAGIDEARAGAAARLVAAAKAPVVAPISVSSRRGRTVAIVSVLAASGLLTGVVFADEGSGPTRRAAQPAASAPSTPSSAVPRVPSSPAGRASARTRIAPARGSQRATQASATRKLPSRSKSTSNVSALAPVVTLTALARPSTAGVVPISFSMNTDFAACVPSRRTGDEIGDLHQASSDRDDRTSCGASDQLTFGRAAGFARSNRSLRNKFVST